MDAHEVIIRPVITERAFDMQQFNRYTFEVARSANKIEIAHAIEEIFNVTVLKVNTVNVKPKPKRQRYRAGLTRQWKKAVITLAKDDTIELFADQA